MNIIIVSDLGHGFYIIKKHSGYNATPEKFLVRMIIDNDEVSNYEEFTSSKFDSRLIKEYNKQLKQICTMDIQETIKDLTVPELKSLLPSYYGIVIDRRIKELEAYAVTKVKRSTKAASTDTGRKRSVRKKSV